MATIRIEISGWRYAGCFVMRGKHYPVANFAERGVLRAETLRFADEVRSGERVGLSTRAVVDAASVAR